MTETKRYNCIIVDDDEVDRLTAVAFARQYSFLNICGIFASAKEALDCCSKQNIQVLLADVDMSEMNGLQLRQQLQHINACIFITSYPDYAVESFEQNALDFLVKPIKAERFAKTMERLQNFLIVTEKANLLDHTVGADSLFIKDGHHQIKIQFHDILYLEALKDYTSIVTQQKKHCVLSSLGNLLKESAFKSFIRIHRSYAVQKHYVTKVSSKEVMINNIELPVGRSYKEFLETLQR